MPGEHDTRRPFRVGTGMLELVEERTRKRREYEERAVELVEAALDFEDGRRSNHGPDRLLAAAQVYATLSR